MKFGLTFAAALAAAMVASSALAAPAPNARGQAQGQGRGPSGSPAAVQAEAATPAEVRRISMQAVIDIIRRRTPGQQSNVVLDGANYRVRWKAENGRLIDYVIDAQTGAIRSAQGE